MNKRQATLIFVCIIRTAAAFAEADEAPKIQAAVKPDKATVGDPLTYQVTIAGRGLKGISVIPPHEREYYPDNKKTARPKPDEAGGKESDPSRFIPLYVIGSIKKNDRSDTGMTDITVTVQMAYFRPGTYTLPQIELRGADGFAIGYKIPTVEIRSVNEKGEFQDIEPPLNLGGNYIRLIFLILGIVAVAIVGFFAFNYIKKLYDRKKSKPSVVPPIEIFLDEIRAFGGDALIDGGRIEEFVFGISMIFRNYLSLQFGFDAAEMTTYEIEKKLRRIFTKSMLDKHFYMIIESLNLWDLSKFAEFTPSRDVLHDNLSKTVTLAKDISGDMSDVAPRV
jgi:hypothetical protein